MHPQSHSLMQFTGAVTMLVGMFIAIPAVNNALERSKRKDEPDKSEATETERAPDSAASSWTHGRA